MNIADVSTTRSALTIATLAYDLDSVRHYFYINATQPIHVCIKALVDHRSEIRSNWMNAAQEILETLHPSSCIRLRRINLISRVREKVDAKYREYAARTPKGHKELQYADVRQTNQRVGS